MRTPHHALSWLVVLALSLAACQPADEEEGAPADTTAAEATMPEAPHEMTYTLVVTNPMPHAMNVTATLADGSQIQLGTVPASGESSFSVTGAMGEAVTVTATDDENTHSPTGTVTLPADATTVSWTVQ